MYPLHLAPSLLVVFMVMLAVVPLAMVWLDERRRVAAGDRLVRLRQDVRLREDLARRAVADAAPRQVVILPGA